MSAKDRIVWIDCEMTGLDLAQDELVEVAVVVTDSQLTPLDGGIDVLIKPSASALAGMSDFVKRMHTTSGLLDDLTHAGTLAEANTEIMAYLRSHLPEPKVAPLAGNSVSTDRAFLEKGLPEVANHLHYRTIDVSSFKEMARRWFPRSYIFAPAKNGGHRALADIAESIDELRYYRTLLWPAGEGPDSQTCKDIAAKITASATLGQLHDLNKARTSAEKQADSPQ
ncbi:MAG: oligoribonuclease [Bowdeniella nasicola]|nr:oligoribonuclease [Bowdeniella nasicola]